MTKTAQMNSVTLAHHLRRLADNYSTEAHTLETGNFPQLAQEQREQHAQCLAFADALDNGYMKVDGDLLLVLPG